MSDQIVSAGQPARYQSAAAVAEQLIRNAILDGHYAPGGELREIPLARELGLSRTPIREALLSLHAAGLVDMRRGHTARVRERTLDELMDTYDIRAEVEAYTAQRAAARITPEVVQVLWDSCDRFAKLINAPDTRPLVQENLFFHDAVHRASQNRRAPDIVRALVEMPLLYSSYAFYSPERRGIAAAHHRAITKALAQGNGDRAAAITREHVLQAGGFALDAMRASRLPQSV